MDRQAFIDKWPELHVKYLDLLERYPQKMKEAGDLSQVEFLNEFKDIEHYNIEIDMVDGLDTEDYFAIGHSGCGDYYLMEIGSEDPSVILWNHEIGQPEEDEKYSSLEEFAGEILASREAVQNTLKKKPWWKIF
ncbi:SMI1/KNR4 family protein [Aestuariirhabdus sp. Z084]|uniref:SMI1/KNR4 family protein n=1 Tax=Aestuariirhabdus haliotis TaxID=2918751 RepID=UPI00201B3762|nr:SMI1/KNR4 family protein [Aestuariirhabdus haliotis]MCL6417649.1 SMI1/KNR4 family protein [Aestuariirhabdus haliotis]MCL6421589.1 SMI1/KNR4 family protein [Aestuariirhabdus haliotis]